MRLPTYKRHVTGRAFTTIRGKDFYLGPYDSPESKEAFGRLLAEYLSTDAKHTFKRKPSELLIVELIASYLDYAREYYGTGPNSEFLRIRTVTKTLGKLYGDTLAEEFGPTRFKAVRYTMRWASDWTDQRSEPCVISSGLSSRIVFCRRSQLPHLSATLPHGIRAQR